MIDVNKDPQIKSQNYCEIQLSTLTHNEGSQASKINGTEKNGQDCFQSNGAEENRIQNLLENNGVSIKNGSSFANWKNVYNPSEKDHNKDSYCSSFLEELRKMLLAEVKQLATYNRTQIYENEFLASLEGTYSDRGYISHARTALHTMKTVCMELFGHDQFVKVMMDLEFLNTVLDSVGNKKSFPKLKTFINKFYGYYFDKLGYISLAPERSLIHRVLTSYGKEPRQRAMEEKKLHKHIEGYLNYLTNNRLKGHKAVRLHLTALLIWLVDNRLVPSNNYLEIDVTNITYEHLAAYKEYLHLRVLKDEWIPDSAQNHIKHIRRWFEYLRLFKYIPFNPCHRLANFTVLRRKIQNLPELTDIDRFLDAIVANEQDVLQWFSLFVTMAGMGLRAQELLDLNVGSIDLIGEEVLVLRKGGKEKILPIPGVVMLALELHFKSMPQKNPSDPIWSNPSGTRVAYDTVRHKFNRYAEMCGMKRNVGACHSLRRLLFTELFLEDGDLVKLAYFAGHESVVTLNRYIIARKSDVKKSFKSKFKTVGSELNALKP